MSLFEDWYITVRSGPNIDVYDDLKLDQEGEYYYQETYWMHKAFLAGQVLRADQTVLNADTAFEVLDSPEAPNEKLMELLEGK